MLRDNPSQAQIDDLTATIASIEATYQSVRQTAATVALMYQQGQATCETIRDYNLMAIAVYNTQVGMLAALTAAGQDGVPAAPPAPTLFNYTDASGNTAPLVSCTVPGATATNITSSGGSGTSGARLGRAYGLAAGAAAPPGVLPHNSLTVSTGDPHWTNPQPSISWMNQNAGQNFSGLGQEVPLAIWVIGGIALSIVTVVAVQAIISYFTQASIARSNADAIKAKQEAFQQMTNAITSCYQTCVGKGADPTDCTSSCSKAFPQPSFDVPTSTNWSFWSLLGLGALTATVGALLYRRYTRYGYLFPQREIAHEAVAHE